MPKRNWWPILLITFAGLHAQEAVPVAHYVFEQFSKGRVLQKNGHADDAMLNYNVLSREMIFESTPGQYLALASPNNVDTVYILDRKFVPANGEFYELLLGGPYRLFLQYACTIKEPGAGLGYGMSSVTTASPALQALIKNGGAYHLTLPDGFEVVPVYIYWVYTNGGYNKVSNAKQVMALVPGKKEALAAFIKANNINFSKRHDMIELAKQL